MCFNYFCFTYFLNVCEGEKIEKHPNICIVNILNCIFFINSISSIYFFFLGSPFFFFFFPLNYSHSPKMCFVFIHFKTCERDKYHRGQRSQNIHYIHRKVIYVYYAMHYTLKIISTLYHSKGTIINLSDWEVKL